MNIYVLLAVDTLVSHSSTISQSSVDTEYKGSRSWKNSKLAVDRADSVLIDLSVEV